MEKLGHFSFILLKQKLVTKILNPTKKKEYIYSLLSTYLKYGYARKEYRFVY